MYEYVYLVVNVNPGGTTKYNNTINSKKTQKKRLTFYFYDIQR